MTAQRMVVLRGIEAQCPLCGRVFGGDSGAERHKPYTRPRTKQCKNPEELGMRAIDRRGLTVWVQSYPRAQKGKT